MVSDYSNHEDQDKTVRTSPPKPQDPYRKKKKKKQKHMKSRILTNPNICAGEPFLKGTRIPVHIILTHLSSGEDDETILDNFPKLKQADINACREYAEKRARKRYHD